MMERSVNVNVIAMLPSESYDVFLHCHKVMLDEACVYDEYSILAETHQQNVERFPLLAMSYEMKP